MPDEVAGVHEPEPITIQIDRVHYKVDVTEMTGEQLRHLPRGRKRHPTDYYLNWRAAGLTRRPHRGHYAAPYFRQCEDAGCHIEVSWALEEHPDQRERRAAEERLIQLHYAAMGSDPPIQHGGRGVEGYLRRQHGA